MTTYQFTCFSSPADGICSGSMILQAGGEKGPKVSQSLQCPPRLLCCARVTQPLQHKILCLMWPVWSWHFINVCSWSAVLVQCSGGLRKACAGAQASSQPEPEGCFCDSPRPSNNGTYLLPSCLLLAVPQCFVDMSITGCFNCCMSMAMSHHVA